MSRLLFWALCFQQAAAVSTAPFFDGARAAPGSQAAPQISGNTSPGQPAAGGLDPAAATFASEGGLLIVTVKPDKVADYEEAIRALQEAFSKTADERRRAMAEGWRVYKATEPDAKTNILYIHVIHPALENEDYRPSLLLDELLAGAPPELLSKYRDAIASPPNKLGLTEVAHMSVAPVAKPANESPGGPAPVKKPGG